MRINQTRALRIARTETMCTYRESTLKNYQLNSGVLHGWIWMSVRTARTCAMCWAMHGTKHGLDEMLDDHPNGRCTMLPWTKSWSELGYDGAPDNPTLEPGVVLFDKLNPEKQHSILGPAKFAAWRDGRFTLSQIVGRRNDPRWGSMRFERSLKDLIGEDATNYTRLALMGAVRTDDYTIDDLIKVAGLGTRDLTAGEVSRIVKYVASAGFNPDGLERCGGRLAGLVWNGKTLKGSDYLSPGEVHYLRHVTINKEWPAGTSPSEYYRSLEQVVRDEGSRILVNKLCNEWQIRFLEENPGSMYNYTWVDYRVSTRH